MLCSIIGIGGFSAIVLPHPSSWIIPTECNHLEGEVIDRDVIDRFCLMDDFCTGDTTLTIDPVDNDKDNLTIHVSPMVYNSHPVGSHYNDYYCE